MREEREEYKALILEAARIAVKGGVLSTAYEDFVIDYLDRIVDGLDDNDFMYLVENGKIPVRAFQTYEGHKAAKELLIAVKSLRQNPGITDMDKRNIEDYTAAIKALVAEQKVINRPDPGTNEIDELRQRIFKAADILDEMEKDDPQLPEYKRLYQALWDRLRELETKGRN